MTWSTPNASMSANRPPGTGDPARPPDLCRVGPLARGRHRPAVDQQDVGVGVEVELRLHPGPDVAWDVLVPDRGRLHDVAVAVEDRKGLRAHDDHPQRGCASGSIPSVSLATTS